MFFCPQLLNIMGVFVHICKLKWISVIDSLPEENETVLCYGTLVKIYRNYETGIFVAKFSTSRSRKGSDGNTDWSFPVIDGYNYLNDVTHWMPLPHEPVTK